MNQNEYPIILFDGVCNLCNASVRFILKYEKDEVFRFGTLQSETAQKILEKFKPIKIYNSVIFIENGMLYQESRAALKIARRLKYFWLLHYLIYLPNWFRDPFYKLIAKNRYSWFGKKDQCMIPDENLKKRFIE